jgi:O-antigen/teichoic acid export membrane protein
MSIAFVSFFSSLANFGLNIIYERDFFNDKFKNNQNILFYSIILFVISTHIFFGFLFFLIRNQLSFIVFRNLDYANIIIITYASISVTNIKNYFLLFYKNSLQHSKFCIYSIDDIILNFIISIFLILFLKIGIIGIPLSQLIGTAIMLIYLFFKISKNFKFEYSINVLTTSLNEALPLLPKSFLSIASAQLDKYLIGVVSTLSNVGIYSLGQKLAYFVFHFMNVLQNMYSPVVYTYLHTLDKNIAGKKIGNYLEKYFYLSALGALVIGLFSKEFFILFSTNNFYDASYVTVFLSLMYLSYFFSKQPQLIFAKKIFISNYITIFSLISNFFLTYFFINLYGLIGAALGTYIASLFSVILSYVITQKVYKINYNLNIIVSIYLYVFLSLVLNLYINHIETLLLYKISFKLFLVLLFLYLYFKILNLSFKDFIRIFKT